MIKKERVTTAESQPLRVFTEKAYLNYSMYVILDRALPHLGDGLKPVQRRIIYAMSELNLTAAAKYKKSARTIGDVLGKFHPHGDVACYEAMVLMAQDFSYRYPLINGQGNWGSADDPKSFAAMRYTEAKLSSYAQALLTELDQGTVQWQANFDGTLNEPTVLPARVPNLLLNGVSGIAVGMATDIPPHNLNELTAACMHLLDEPRATVAELCQFMPGPDFPTTAEIITSKETLIVMYESGNGSIRMRAVYSKEDKQIVFTALPYQVSGAKVIEQIAQQMQTKKLPMIDDIRDESDHEHSTRIVISLRCNSVDSESLLSHLFATTDLQRTYRVNINVIGLDGKPQVKNLLMLLTEWLEFRRQTVTRRLRHRLAKITQRLHILVGLLEAYINLDIVIDIIRTEDDPKQKIMQRLNLSEMQAEAILELKLRYLAKLRETKIKMEQQALMVEKKMIEATLTSKEKMKVLLKKELQQVAEAFGDSRRSPIVARDEASAIDVTELTPSEPVTVILSEKGWVRVAKGHDIDVRALNYRSGDTYKASAKGNSKQTVVFFDASGRAFSLPAHSLPPARGQGEPLTRRVKSQGCGFDAVTIGESETKVLLAADSGYGFIANVEELMTKNKRGKALIRVPQGGHVLSIYSVMDIVQNRIVAVTNTGYLLMFMVNELPKLAKGKGNKIINIPMENYKSKEEYVIDVAVLHGKQALRIYSGKRHITLKTKDLVHYLGKRGQRGSKLPRGYQRVSSIQVIG